MAWPRLHAVPHVPQLLSVFSCASHPFASLPSQFPQPVLHVRIAHEPVEHEAVALARTHAVAHPPQLARVLSCSSHPFALLPSQLPHPVVHTGVQSPDEQLVVPWPLVHARPQAPQFVVVVRLVSQPSVTLELQFPNPALQITEHAPKAHTGVAFAPPHVVPQVPQLLRLVCVLVSAPVCGVVVAARVTHAARGGACSCHARRRAVGIGACSAARSAAAHGRLQVRSAPIVRIAIAVHPTLWRRPARTRPAMQEVPPCGFEHTVPHAPQLFTFVCTSASQPFAGLPSQLANPVVHVGTHKPFVQAVPP